MGNLEGSKATQIAMQGTTSVGGRLQLIGTTGQILFRSEKVGGNVEINGGTASVSLTDGEVGGNLQIENTSGAAFGESALVNIAGVSVGGRRPSGEQLTDRLLPEQNYSCRQLGCWQSPALQQLGAGR
jgi:hypothetical protein